MITSHQLPSVQIDEVEIPPELVDALLSELFAIPSQRKIVSESIPDFDLTTTSNGFVVEMPSADVVKQVIKPVFEHNSTGNAVAFAKEDTALYIFASPDANEVYYLSVDCKSEHCFNFPNDFCLRTLTPVSIPNGEVAV